MKRSSVFSFGLAILAITNPVGAQAAESCLSEKEISALTVYMMPRLIAATQAGCKAQLAPDGFFATSGTAMAERYAEKADTTWPLAKSPS